MRTQKASKILDKALPENFYTFIMERAFSEKLELVVSDLGGHSHGAFLLIIRTETGSRKFVFKSCEDMDMRSKKVLTTEFLLIQSLAKDSTILTPQALEQVFLNDHQFFFYEFIVGNRLDSENITQETARRIAEQTRRVQKKLVEISIADTRLIRQELEEPINHAHKIAKYLTSAFKKELPLSSLKYINRVLSAPQRRKLRTLISDRNPLNWIRQADGHLVSFDYDLIKIGYCYEDWILFIDRPELKTNLTRDELIEIFFTQSQLHYHTKIHYEGFHVNAVAQNLIQASLFLNMDRAKSLHYLERAQNSALKVNMPDMQIFIQSLQSQY